MNEPLTESPLTNTGKFRREIKALLNLSDDTPDDSVLAQVMALMRQNKTLDYAIKQIKITDESIRRYARGIIGSSKGIDELLDARRDTIEDVKE